MFSSWAALTAAFNETTVKALWIGGVVLMLQYLWENNRKKPPTNSQEGSSPPTSRAVPEGSVPTLGEPEGPAAEQAVTAEDVAKFMSKAESFKSELGDGNLSVEHLILALADNPRFGEILSCAEGLTEEELKRAIKKSRVLYNHADAGDLDFEKGALSKYARDLTAAARDLKLDPVIGRNDEIRRCINILSRRTKNNPILIGDSGVGKTAVVEGLAQRIAAGDVPETLKDVSIMALDMGSMMAGAFFPGEFEERMKAVLKELTNDPGRFVLFIDDIHSVTGPNAQQGGGVMDASVLLKPLLGKGALRCMGCTTMDKFRKFIEKDPALERRFQQVTIEQPSVSQAVSILRGLRRRYESHHRVRISDAAIVAAVTLSARYLPDRFLPDKAIDLVDEATAKVKMDKDLKPELLDQIDRRIKDLEGERHLLQRTAKRDRSDAAQLQATETELADLKKQQLELAQKLEDEKAEGAELTRLQEEVAQLSAEVQDAEGSGAGKATLAALRVKRTAALKRLLEGRKLAEQQAPQRLARERVTETDIARAISKWTGIPLTKLVQSERDRLLHLGDELHRRIIGQDPAVEAVAEAIQRSRAGMKDPNGPIASFLFLGPTGVGKTELAKALAVSLFNSEEAMVRLDMSEYMEKHAVSKLIGAPPGYVGFDEGGQLTEQVRRRPYTVVLFDEVEKAHVDVFNILLQILDDGRATDSQGRTVNFKNTIIIMTSNLGSVELYQLAAKQAAAKKLTFDPLKKEAAAQAAPTQSEIRDKVMEHVRKHFPPEFMNRVDEFIVFEPLQPDQIKEIVKLRTAGVVQRMGVEKRIRLELQPSAVDYLASKGYDPLFGARPVKRAVQRDLETPLAKALLIGEFTEDDVVVVEAAEAGKGLVFSHAQAEVQADGSDSTTNASGDAATSSSRPPPGPGEEEAALLEELAAMSDDEPFEELPAPSSSNASSSVLPVPPVAPPASQEASSSSSSSTVPAAAAAAAAARPAGRAAAAAAPIKAPDANGSQMNGSPAGAATGTKRMFDPLRKQPPKQ